MRATKFVVIILALLLAVGALAFAIVPRLNGRLLFKRLVVHPIPPSVQQIKADSCRISSLLDRLDGLDGLECVLRDCLVLLEHSEKAALIRHKGCGRAILSRRS